MKLGAMLSKLTRPEIELLEQNLNLTDDEYVIFIHLTKGRDKGYIADSCNISIGTVSNRIADIKDKLKRLGVI